MINLRRRVMGGSGYKPYDEEVLYLESTGTQYIDLGLQLFTKSSGTVQFDIDVWVSGSDQTNYASILNAMQEISPYPGFVLRYNDGHIDSVFTNSSGNTWTRVGDVWTQQHITTTVTRDSGSVNNVSTTLFAGYDGSGNPWRYIKMQLYGCKIYDDGVLVCDLIPVVKSGVGYLYDRVSGQLFGNLGTGSFSYGDTVEFTYTGASQLYKLQPGRYKLECWGAQGGSYNTTYIGGKGGYSTGVVTINTQTQIYVYVGGQGLSGNGGGSKSGGYNGGGNSYSGSTYIYPCGSGGGASDIRIENDSLYARVIVAGGGGGYATYGYRSPSRYSGGYGGGTEGGTGEQYSSSYKAGTGGTQTRKGTSYWETIENSTTYGNIAAFGIGGGAKDNLREIAGGGGGWYGGGYSHYSAGGGGSGYVYTSNTASNYPSGCLLSSSYYLKNAETKAGNTSFPALGGGNETGHEGNGYVRITKIS